MDLLDPMGLDEWQGVSKSNRIVNNLELVSLPVRYACFLLAKMIW